MIVALIHWRIRPDDDNKNAFIEHLEDEQLHSRSHRAHCGVPERLYEDRRFSVDHLALGPGVAGQLQVIRHSGTMAGLGCLQRASCQLLQR